MPEAQQKPAEPNSRRLVTRLGDKVTDQAVAWVFSGGVVTAITVVAANWPKIRAIFWETKVSLIWLSILAIPAAFGLYAFYRVVARRYIPLYFTIDPTQAHITECWNMQPRERMINLQLVVTVANPTKDRTLILYAYLKGTRPITHFNEPIEVAPLSAMLEQHMSAEMTAPKRRPKDGRYTGTVYFVDAGGHRYEQKAQFTYHSVLPAVALSNASLNAALPAQSETVKTKESVEA